jgi:hypothetical protein
MAQTIVILCDECLASGTEVPGQTWAVSVGAPGTKAAPYVVDACDMHAEPYRALLKGLGEYGRRSDKRPPLPRVSTAGGDGDATAAAAGVGAAVCPVCGFVSATLGGTKSHVKVAHGVSLAEANGTAKIKCPEPECPRYLDTYQGLSAHLRSGHGYPVAKARKAVETAGGGRG